MEGGNQMENFQTRVMRPGQYRFRPSQMWPWMNVNVFRESAVNQDKLCVRLAGLELAADRLKGQWKMV